VKISERTALRLAVALAIAVTALVALLLWLAIRAAPEPPEDMFLGFSARTYAGDTA
jgi:hypothetical protein